MLEDDKIKKITSRINKPQGVEELKKKVAKKEVHTDKLKQRLRKSKIRSIRTYEGDLYDTVKEKKSTSTSIRLDKLKTSGLANKERRSRTKSQTLKTISTLIILGLLILGGAYFLMSRNNPVEITASIESIIPHDVNETIHFPTLDRDPFRERLSTFVVSGDIAPRSLLFLNLVHGLTYTKISSQDFFSTLGVGALPSLIRSFDPEFMLGYYVITPGDSHPFLLLKTNSFEISFAGMLTWESNITQDLSPAFGKNLQGDIFSDKIVDNENIRLITNSLGETLLYSFIDKDTLLITTSEEAFSEINSRFITSQFAR